MHRGDGRETAEDGKGEAGGSEGKADAAGWAIFISGTGTNLQALLDAQPALPLRLVVSSHERAQGVERAHKAGLPCLILPRPIDWADLSFQLKAQGVERIFLAGFMKVIPEAFVKEWSHRILNLHPSLLPHYKGLRAMERSYEEGAAMGVTIHWVTADLDEGPILLQQKVFEDGTARRLPFEEVRQQMQRVEHQMVVDAVRRCSPW